MKPYADSNFLSRCYLLLDALPAPSSQLAQAEEAGVSLPVHWLHRLEVRNAIEQHVFAARTLGQTRVTPEMAAAARLRFSDDCVDPGSLLRLVVLDFSQLEALFQELSLRHTAKHGFRTYDLLHVASCILLGCDTFWSFDQKASKLAALEGLKVLASKRK